MLSPGGKSCELITKTVVGANRKRLIYLDTVRVDSISKVSSTIRFKIVGEKDSGYFFIDKSVCVMVVVARPMIFLFMVRKYASCVMDSGKYFERSSIDACIGNV